MARQSLKARIEKKIRRSSRNVFLRSDFKRLGDYDQVGRALRELVADAKLIKIGYGLYAKARPNRITNRPMLAGSGGFDSIVQEALTRLKVGWEPAATTKAYQMGSTQIPVNAEVAVVGRFSRKIGTDKFQLRTYKAE